MLRTLRITSIIAAIAAGVLLICATVYGVRSDSQIEEFLKAPGAIDKFTASLSDAGAMARRGEGQVSPLVKEAAEFGLYLNPPPPPPPPVAPGEAPAQHEPAPMAPVSAKFDLIGTSFYASQPEMSLALIDEPGKGLHWVRQGSSVAHLTIERIDDKAITVRDGARSFEMTVKVQEPWRNLLKNQLPLSNLGPQPSPTSRAPEPKMGAGLAEGNETPMDRIGVGQGRPGQRVVTRRPGIRTRDTRRSPRFAGEAGESRPSPESHQAPGGTVPEPVTESSATPVEPQAPPAQGDDAAPGPPKSEKQAKLDQLMAEFASSRITDDEAGRMEQLVEALKQLEESEATAPPQAGVEPQSESPGQSDAPPTQTEPNTPHDANR